MGESTSAVTDDEMKDRRRVIRGEDAVRMSAVMDDEMSASGRPTMAESKLRMKVLRVGRSNE
jgi:hypothetical protein